MNSKDFFQAKLDEQIQRNGKFNDTAYNLEPNIKESHGGLRDIQMIAWVAKRHFNTDNMEELMRHADTAMYSAKAQGRNNFQFFSEEMNRHALDLLNTENHLQDALKNEEFELHVQPIIDSTTGELVSGEALLRWLTKVVLRGKVSVRTTFSAATSRGFCT